MRIVLNELGLKADEFREGVIEHSKNDKELRRILNQKLVVETSEPISKEKCFEVTKEYYNINIELVDQFIKYH